MSTHLQSQKCQPCEGGIEPLKRPDFEQYLSQITDWKVIDEEKIQKKFKFKNFKAALTFVNQVGDLAETEGHHPDISLYGWNKVKITLATHAVKGLSVNDFILASKIDEIRS